MLDITMFELLKQPGFLGTHATLGADLSQLMAMLFTGVFIIGWIQAKRGRGHAHHWLMLGGMIAMLSFFVSYYCSDNLEPSPSQEKKGLVDHKICTPIFSGHSSLFHIVLVIVGLIMAVYMIVLGFRAQAIDGVRRILADRILSNDLEESGNLFLEP